MHICGALILKATTFVFTGALLRPNSFTHFVYEIDTSDEVQGCAQVVSWLENIVISRDVAEDICSKTFQRLRERNGVQFAKVYYVWPVFYWPDKSPVGLKDTTSISLAWSVTRDLPSLPTVRRLFALPDTKSVENKTLPKSRRLPSILQQTKIPHFHRIKPKLPVFK